MNSFGVVEVENQITLADGAQRDAFGRMRVSDPNTIFDSKHTRGFTEDSFWSSSLGSGGAVAINANASAVDLTVPTTNGAFAIWQTREYFAYQPGKSQNVVQTFVFGAAKENVTRRAGYFDANDGIFLEQTNAGISFVVRTSTSGAPVDGAVAQSLWNVDKLDGTGVSGLTIDLSKTQILYIDFQWLGVGRVRVGFVIDGVARICHEFKHANVLSVVYMKTPSLPVRFEIRNTGLSASSTALQAICAAVSSEGGRSLRGLTLSVASLGAVKTLSSGVWTPLVCVRPRAANVRVPVLPHSWSIATGSANKILMGVFLLRAGGTHVLTGPSWVAHPSGQSSIEYDISATALTPGNAPLIASSYFSGNAKGDAVVGAASDSLKACADVAGTADIICLAGFSVGGNSTNSVGSLTWLEEI